MSLASDLQNLRQKKAQEKATNSNISNLAKTYSALRRKKLLGEDAENDIGPVGAVDTFKAAFSEQAKRQTQQERERTWFTAGGFDDGYQFGDVTKTILGTAFDAAANVGGGLLEMGENFVDAGAYLVGGAGELFGAKDFAEGTKNFIANDLYSGEEIASRIISLGAVGEGGFDDSSILGEKLDSIAQSGGQLAGNLAITYASGGAIPWWVTSGVTSFGKEVESAFNEGADYGQAGLRGLISAGAEILTEKLFGGSGLGERGLINLDGLTKALSGKTVKAFAELGIDMAAEGVEEVVSSVINRMGSALYKEENLAELLTSEEAVDEYIESFIGGAALGGIMNAAKVDQDGGKATGGVKYSLTEPFTDLNGTHFENAVLLDTDLFDGISPRNWGDKLQDEVNRRASTNPLIMPIVDENGNTTLLQFASPKETVRKNGGSKHNVLDELSQTTDNISKLAVIHIDEIVSVSEENSPYFTQGNEHGWMDKNGWLHRNANVINQKNGNIYNLTVDIAKTADGRTILYATKGKIKKVGTVKVNSLKIKGSRQNSNFSNILPQKEDSVKGYSLSAEGETPIKRGNFNIRGEDVLLDAPIREDISRAETTEDIAPIRDDIANVVEEENKKKARLSRSIKRIYRNFEQDKADLQEEINLRRDKLPINDDSGHYALDQEYQSRLKELELQAETKVKNAKTAEQRKVKHENLQAKIERIAGDISTWVDKKFGFSYKTNTLRRNLRDIVRDENGNRDIAKADEIYELLQGNYNKHEAELNKEANRIKKVYADMKITDAESTYIQMLGEFRHNPDTQLKKEDVDKFLLKNKSKIDEAKVDKAIELARETYDSLLVRVNEALREAGMKEIPYRKGYFPHFTEDKQGWLAKLFNWKTQNNDIPTDIAGITEQFNPNRTWQPFNKQRKSDTTDYNFLKGMDNYVFGALDWIYHIEDIQTRREFENFIRYSHSEEGVREKIAAIRANDELDADETQDQIDLVYATAANPLNNFVTDLRAGTNKLANKKSSLDRGMEEMVNRKVYSTLTNISNRVSANMVGGSISSALTNFIPITQSWGQVSPISSLKAMVDTIRSKFRDDGTVQKSTFLTNRLETVENLYQTKWDKFSDKIGALMEGIDSFTSQTVWRSKYLENISKGMSEADAIANADQFAENVMAGRSRGNMPTIFDSKNPLIKTLTAFQLEVANQYGYMLKDMPQDVKEKTKGNLVKGYAAMFFGAYAYNALFSALTGRDAAFDPIGIIEDLLKDLGLFGDDDKEEPVDAALNLAENIAQEIPFFGGLIGGGRVPISSALPYDGNLFDMIEATGKAIESKDFTALTKEWLKPLYYVAMPVGGGQLKKTVEGLSMFSDDLPIAGSYTNSGDLRFPVEDNFGNRLQAALFGQWSSQNAREYFDKGWSPLNEKQQQEFKDSGMTIQEYHDYREGLKDLSTQADKVDYINGLDLTDTQKNVLLNNVLDRDTKVDVSELSQYGDLEEFDFAQENPQKYKWLNDNGYSYSEYKNADEDGKRALTWASENPAKYEVSKVVVDNIFEYRKITGDLYNLKADKDANGNTISGSKKKKVLNYINNLDLDYGAKLILYKSEYKSDDTYNSDIVEYLNSRDDLSFSQIKTILEELDFGVDSKGNISW